MHFLFQIYLILTREQNLGCHFKQPEVITNRFFRIPPSKHDAFCCFSFQKVTTKIHQLTCFCLAHKFCFFKFRPGFVFYPFYTRRVALLISVVVEHTPFYLVWESFQFLLDLAKSDLAQGVIFLNSANVNNLYNTWENWCWKKRKKPSQTK